MIAFIDTNIFLRHLTGDDPVQSPACLALFQTIERGELTVWTTQLVIMEIVYALTRVYDRSRVEIRDQLLPLLSMPGIRLDQKQMMGRVFELYVTKSIDYVDAYHAAWLEGQGSLVYSYDAHFDRIPGLERLEP